MKFLRVIRQFTVFFIVGMCLAIVPLSVQAKALPFAKVQISSSVLKQDSIELSNPSSELESGRSYYAAGRFDQAAVVWQAAASGYADRGEVAQQILCLSYLSLARQALSQWQEAEQAITTGLVLLNQVFDSVNPILHAQVLNTQASLQLQLGQFQAALRIWEKTETFYQEAGDNIGVIGSRVNQAQALQQLGFYRRARGILESINEQLSQMPVSELKVTALRNLGAARQRVGDYRAAYSILSESLRVADQLNATGERNAILLDIGRLAANLDNDEAALTYFEIVRKEATSPLVKLQAQLEELEIHLKSQRWQAAQALLTQALEILSELPPSHGSMYGAINLISNVTQYAGSQQLMSSQDLNQLATKVIRNAQQLGDVRAEAYGLKQLGELYIQAGQNGAAIDSIQQSLLLARSQQANDIVAQAAWQLGRVLRQNGQYTAAADAYQEAVESLKSLRGDLIAINRDVQFSFQNSVEPVYREYISLLLTENPDQSELEQARKLIESLQLAELDDFFRQACLDTQPKEIDQIDPKAVVIYPIILPDQLAVIVSKLGQPLSYYRTSIDKTKVEVTLTHLLELLHPSSDHQERLRVSQQVYDWLIRPIEQQQVLTNDETLVFVLDGLMRNIPMATLHDGKNYLIEKYAVALSPGLQLMAAQPLNRANLSTLIGGISESRNGFSSLPAVVREVTEISKMVGASPLLNEEFTSSEVAKQLQNSSANIVHLATHGQFGSQQEDTFLLTWEGKINIWQLSELMQSRGTRSGDAIELLILSACNTASGDDRAVLGLAGLAVKSGARSTIATLWPVKDEAAASLMVDFYESFQQADLTKAEALRQAQLTLMRDPSYKDPFYWSSYVLIGNWL
ncbi:CHAT domain-containing protein [Leptolyngbya sp. PCC 6406]|uniref:CHAT domain-containing protein n=1 Tax=Leptolyngbya sp. PCC 6406 TaxID=1173264 RepID=UPI0002AC06A4|nr:CHAT domain-containing protein [Leptolyngbya sp. PCC 6406]